MYQMPAFINASIPRQTAIVTILHSARLNMICGTYLERTATEKCGDWPRSVVRHTTRLSCFSVFLRFSLKCNVKIICYKHLNDADVSKILFYYFYIFSVVGETKFNWFELKDRIGNARQFLGAKLLVATVKTRFILNPFKTDKYHVYWYT